MSDDELKAMHAKAVQNREKGGEPDANAKALLAEISPIILPWASKYHPEWVGKSVSQEEQMEHGFALLKDMNTHGCPQYPVDRAEKILASIGTGAAHHRMAFGSILALLVGWFLF